MVNFTEAAVGESLRDRREASGMTMGQAAGHCSIPLTYLMKIEAGSSGPTAEVMQQLIRLYSPSEIVLSDDATNGLEHDERKPRKDDCEIDWVSLVKAAGSRRNIEILHEVAHGIRALRNFGEATPVIMREVEADILISLLDLTDPNLLVDIMQAFSLSASQADEFIASSVRRFERRALPTDGLLLDRLQANPALWY